MKKLENKVALITGATSGIGKATAIDFIENGATVVLAGRHQDTVDEAVNELGRMAQGFVSDAGKMSDLMSIADKVKKISPFVDILYVNAGFGKYAPIAAITKEHIDEQFDVLVKGTLFTVQQIIPFMKEGTSFINGSEIFVDGGFPRIK